MPVNYSSQVKNTSRIANAKFTTINIPNNEPPKSNNIGLDTSAGWTTTDFGPTNFPRLQGLFLHDSIVSGVWRWATDADFVKTAPRAVGVLVSCKEGQLRKYLLGKEAFRPKFNASHTWCDFGGGVEGKDSPLWGAARELHEETIGMFASDLTETVAFIRNNTIGIVRSYLGDRFPYDMFVLDVTPDVIGNTAVAMRTFRHRRMSMLHRSSSGDVRVIAADASKNNCYLEKCELAWFFTGPEKKLIRIGCNSAFPKRRRKGWGFGARTHVMRSEFQPIFSSIPENIFA